MSVEDHIKPKKLEGYEFDCPDCSKTISSTSKKRVIAYARQHRTMAHGD